MTAPDGADDEVLLAAAGWGGTLDRVLAGLAHDVNGRAAALRGLLELTTLGEEPGSVTALLEDEVGRLEEVASTLSALPAVGAAGPELLSPAEVLSGVLPLHRRHRGLEGVAVDVEVDPETPPVRASRTLLARGLLVALGACAWSAAERGRPLRVRCGTGPHGGAEMEVGEGATGEGRRPAGAGRPAGPAGGAPRDALRELFLRQGIEVTTRDEAGGSFRLRLRFPPP